MGLYVSKSEDQLDRGRSGFPPGPDCDIEAQLDISGSALPCRPKTSASTTLCHSVPCELKSLFSVVSGSCHEQCREDIIDTFVDNLRYVPKQEDKIEEELNDIHRTASEGKLHMYFVRIATL